VALLAGERRVRVDFSIEITSKNVLDKSGALDVLGLAVWQLNPVVEQVVGDPVNKGVDTFTALLNRGVRAALLLLAQGTRSQPIVLLSAVHLTREANRLST